MGKTIKITSSSHVFPFNKYNQKADIKNKQIWSHHLCTVSAPFIPVSPTPASSKNHFASWPSCQRYTGDITLLWAPIQRTHCTAAKSLRWYSAMPVLIQHMQDTHCSSLLCPLLMRMSAVTESGWMSVPSREQTATMSLSPPILQWGLWCWRLWSNCLRQARRRENYHDRSPRKHGTKGHRSWDNCITINYYAVTWGWGCY